MAALVSPPSGAEGYVLARPGRTWRWSQSWQNVLFAHWEVGEDWLRAMLPRALDLDRWQGRPWVSAVAFRLARVQLRGLPPIPLCTNFLEVNLRSYVRYRGEPGIYFLSMHADSRVAALAARWMTPLPYEYTPMKCRYEQEQWHWQCGGGAAHQPVLLDGRFRKQGEAALAVAGSLEAWLVERYAAFVPDRQRRLYRMACEHAPWKVSPAACNITHLGFPSQLNRTPNVCHISSGLEALLGPFEPL